MPYTQLLDARQALADAGEAGAAAATQARQQAAARQGAGGEVLAAVHAAMSDDLNTAQVQTKYEGRDSVSGSKAVSIAGTTTPAMLTFHLSSSSLLLIMLAFCIIVIPFLCQKATEVHGLQVPLGISCTA